MQKLDVELLAEVLQHLQPADRLRSAALVNSTWKTAAAMATHEIQLHCRTQAHNTRFATLSDWFAANGHTAALTRLEARAPVPDHNCPITELFPQEQPELGLPDMRFQQLRCLGA